MSDLTTAEANELLDALRVTPGALRRPHGLTERERLAVGIVVLRKTLAGEATQRELADEWGISTASISRYKSAALEKLGTPTADEARKEQLEIVMDLLKVWVPLSKNGDKDALAAVDKLLTRWAKLTGADKPLEVSASVVEETLEDRQLRELVEQQERDNKLATAREESRTSTAG